MAVRCDRCKRKALVAYDKKAGMYLCIRCINNKGKVR